MGLGLTKAKANEIYSLNKDFALLLEKYFAYSLTEEDEAKKLIKELRSQNDILNQEDLRKFLKKFKNDHLSILSDTSYHQGPCISKEKGKMIIHTFWCQTKASESLKEIRYRFANEFIKNLKALIVDTKVKVLRIDLKGNKGGGDNEMELALFPFIKEGEHLYNYQFKFLTSPHIFPRVLTKLVSFLGLENNLKNIWDKVRGHSFFFKRELWTQEHYKNLVEIKKVIDEKKLDIIIEVDKETASASELFLAILSKKKNVKVQGAPTKGCVGAPETYLFRGMKVTIPAVRIIP